MRRDLQAIDQAREVVDVVVTIEPVVLVDAVGDVVTFVAFSVAVAVPVPVSVAVVMGVSVVAIAVRVTVAIAVRLQWMRPACHWQEASTPVNSV